MDNNEFVRRSLSSTIYTFVDDRILFLLMDEDYGARYVPAISAGINRGCAASFWLLLVVLAECFCCAPCCRDVCVCGCCERAEHKNKRKQRSVAIAASVKSQAKPTSDLRK
jgi:hypothetical protein